MNLDTRIARPGRAQLCVWHVRRDSLVSGVINLRLAQVRMLVMVEI